jgi:hypothetical protein
MCSRISTARPLATPAFTGLTLGADSPSAKQCCEGNLGFSAVRILIGLTLLIPAFSLEVAPP